MADKLDSLLKTSNSMPEDSQSEKEDVLYASKCAMRKICKDLCVPLSDYRVEETITFLKDYQSRDETKGRILYSEISSYVYGLDEGAQGNIATNIEKLLTYTFDKNNEEEKDLCRIIVKLYDHFQLSISQKNLNDGTENAIEAQLTKAMCEARDSIAKATEDAKKAEKEYITILGIFAAVVLAFVGGLTFSTSVLQHINAVSIYRLLFVIDLIAIVLLNSIYVLLKFLWHINDKEKARVSFYKIKWYNAAFCIFGGLILVAWLFDAKSFHDFFVSFLPW